MVPSPALQGFDRSRSPDSVRGRSLLFIDPRVDDPRTLLAGVRPNVEAIVLDPRRSGMKQIDAVLRSQPGVREVHIASHGKPGEFQLGADWVNDRLLGHYARMLEHWREFLTDDAEISLYGCRVAAGTAGPALLRQLQQLTGAGVAASVRPTGAAERGGDWILETRTGMVRGQSAFTQVLQQECGSTFETFAVDTLADENDGVDVGGVSLRDAIAAAAPGDSITFDSSLLGGAIALTNGQLQIGTAVTIEGDIDGDGRGDITLDAQGNSRVLSVDNSDAATAIAVEIAGLIISGGIATDAFPTNGGGGIFNSENLTLSNSTVSGNSSDDDGGGIFVSDGTLTVTNSTIAENSASDDGGGIVNSGGVLIVASSTIADNTAEAEGGGIFSDTDLSDTSATLTNSTVTGNVAGTDGGGLYNLDGQLFVTNSTITSNTAPSSSGSGIASFGDEFTVTTVTSSIVAGNANTDIDFVFDNTNSFASNGNNLIGNGNAAGVFNIVGDIAGNADPGLAPLADNGGPTQTIALLSDSPAIDAGSNPDSLASDQRGDGFDRVLGAGPDIGAFEAAPEFTLDVDSNGDVDALTDGLNVLRVLLGAPMQSIVLGPDTPDSVTQDTVFQRIADASNIGTLDADGNDSTNALIDGLNILRVLLGAPVQSIALGLNTPDGITQEAVLTTIEGFL